MGVIMGIVWWVTIVYIWDIYTIYYLVILPLGWLMLYQKVIQLINCFGSYMDIMCSCSSGKYY